MKAHLALARVLTSTAARAAAPSAIPLYLGLFLVLPVLFSPNGLQASTVTGAAKASPLLAASLLAAWLLLTLHVARAVVDLPSTFPLRALPVHRALFLAVTGGHLAVVHLPWAILWARGEGALAGVGAVAVAAGVHGLLLGRSWRPTEIGAMVALGIAALLPSTRTVPLAVMAAPVGVASAFRCAPERSSRVRAGALPRWAPAALAAALLRGARRAEAGVMLRGVLLATLGGLVTPLVCRGYDVEMPAARSALSLQIAAFSLAVAGSGVGASVLRAEQAQTWMLDALGLGGDMRAGAAAGAAGIAGGGLGIVHGLLAAHGLGAGPGLGARLAVEGAAWGMALGVVGAWAARRAQVLGPRRDRVGAIRVLITIGLATVAAGMVGELSLVIAGGAAVMLTGLAARKAAALEPPRSAHRHGDTPR